MGVHLRWLWPPKAPLDRAEHSVGTRIFSILKPKILGVYIVQMPISWGEKVILALLQRFAAAFLLLIQNCIHLPDMYFSIDSKPK
jgi:hypothetical protein